MEASHFNRLLKSISKDEKSFNELYEYYGRRIVFRLTRVYGKEIAEETLHDFFLKLIKHEGKYEYIQKPTSWVYTCCENIAKTKLAKENYKISFNEEIGVSSALDFDFDFENAFIGTELNKLDDISKDIIILHYWKGYSFEEISEILGITYDAIRQRHKRLKKKLKNILQ